MNDSDLEAVANSARARPEDSAARHRLLAIIQDQRIARPPIRRFLFNEDDVAMAEQQTLVAVAFRFEQWSGNGNFGSWVRQIAANEAKMLIRSRDRRRAKEDEGASTAAFIERMSSFLATAADIERLLEQMPALLSDPLDLRQAGHSYSEIAATLGIAEGTAKTRVRKARAELAQNLRDHA